MRKTGIWMDKEKAYVVTLNGSTETFKRLFSEIDFFNPKGGSRSKTRWGPQDVVQDSKYLEREKHQLKTYFKKVVDMIKKADAITLFGPADTAEKFRKELEENHVLLSNKIKAVNKTDSMTENQVKAWVRDFYKSTG